MPPCSVRTSGFEHFPLPHACVQIGLQPATNQDQLPKRHHLPDPRKIESAEHLAKLAGSMTSLVARFKLEKEGRDTQRQGAPKRNVVKRKFSCGQTDGSQVGWSADDRLQDLPLIVRLCKFQCAILLPLIPPAPHPLSIRLK